ncbi:MAG: homocysteine S-methyltransferase family protein [Paracoccaceae bacterium]
MADITLLDGGLGQMMIARSGDEPTPLWSTRVLIDHPGLAQGIHADYFAAGATVATANTYSVHHDRLEKFDLDPRFAALHAQALSEARAARDAHGSGRVAGSLGPLVASYRPDAFPPHAEAVAKYAEIARMDAPLADFFLAETVASLAHARAVLEGAAAGGIPVWLSVTVDDEDGTRLRSGEPVAALGPILRDGGATAALANCSAPEAMAAALEGLLAFGLPAGAYANGFRQITKEFLKDSPTVAALQSRPEMTPELYADFAMTWIGMGARIVGGCCETTPAHIAELSRRLAAAGHRVV